MMSNSKQESENLETYRNLLQATKQWKRLAAELEEWDQTDNQKVYLHWREENLGGPGENQRKLLVLVRSDG